MTGIVFQLCHGYTHFELGAYLLWFFVPELISALLLAALSLFVQVLVPHKAIGWAVMLVYIVASVSLEAMGFEHNLYNYASVSPVPLSDMNGLGRFWIARAWFQVYWLAFALILSEGKAQRASDIDVVWIYGYGWPVYRGGPMFWAGLEGTDKIVAALEKHGFEIAPLLKEKAEAKSGF